MFNFYLIKNQKLEIIVYIKGFCEIKFLKSYLRARTINNIKSHVFTKYLSTIFT